MPQLFITDMGALGRPLPTGDVLPPLPAGMIAAVECAGVTDGMPFILSDDGGYDVELNRFFRACPTMGVRALNSVEAYARDILTWLRFLADRRGGKTLWQADREDIAAFHAARRRSQPPHRISAASWNRCIAALEKLYQWAQEEALIATRPFSYRRVWRHPDGGARGDPMMVSYNRAREPAARHGDVRFLALDRFLLFRDVGLRGRLPDGTEDPHWRGRHGERNALFAELLATTGLRLAEAANLLACELPNLDGPDVRDRRLLPFRLPAAIAKGAKAREIRLPRRLLRQLLDYVELERANALVCGGAHPRDSGRGDLIVAAEVDRKTITLAQGHRPPRRLRLDLLSPAERQRLVIATDNDGKPTPALLWLTEAGGVMTPAAWSAVFRRASARCRAFGIDLNVTPHMLRHTFAVHMLSMLIRAQIGTVVRSGAGDSAGGGAYRRMIGDPLQKLQRLMGHASITSTHVYLDSLEESRALIDAAMDGWTAELAGADASP